MKKAADAAPTVCTAIDGVSVPQLIADHGSPLFVFSETALRRGCREADAAFKSRYPDVQFAWSYKTNYLKAICAVFHAEGAIAEIVSDFEYEKARALGIPGRDIIFNGPYKQAAALKRAVDEDAKIQIDHLDELEVLHALAENKKKMVGVAIRVFLDAGVRPVWSKFGFNAATDEAIQAIKRIARCRFLKLVGLHTHIGTSILEPNAYTTATLKLLELAEFARRDYRFDIDYLNLGGGFPSSSRLHNRDQTVEPIAPSFDDYAAAICQPIVERWPKGRKLPRLYLETGRALVDDAGYLITSIVALKQDSAAYLVDSGIHLLPMSAWHRYNVRPARPIAGPLVERTLFGCLCMNTDVLQENVPLPNMNVGDQLVFHPVGAYNVAQSMQFITYRPRIVMVSQDGHVELIRERENLQHIEALERLPERWKLP